MKYNPDIHHRKSIRIKEYDYSQSGYYFVTICSYNRESIFGKIIDGKIDLNDFGEIVKEELLNTEGNRLYVEIDYYCIMPNHLHFILIINDRGRVTARRAPTETFGNPVKGSLPTIIRSIKSAITKKINEIRKSPGVPLWQRNYYEHIIRNEKELYEIRKYIENNPLNWNRDEYNLL